MTEAVSKYLIREALEAREFSFCPISGFAVGAALLGENENVYRGCNIECAGLTPSNCAERTAFFKAVSEGCLTFQAIAIVGGLKGQPLKDLCPPCGVCRQLMAQFVDHTTFKIILAADENNWEEHTLDELLPMAFVR